MLFRDQIRPVKSKGPNVEVKDVAGIAETLPDAESTSATQSFDLGLGSREFQRRSVEGLRSRYRGSQWTLHFDERIS
jgi:hypothetical protein